MKTLYLALGLLVLTLGVSPIVRAAGNGTITIEAPRQNETIKGSEVTVRWKQVKEGKADHVHIVIDDKREIPVKSGDSKVVRDLAKGPHQLTVQAATVDHELLDVKDTVKITVE